MAAAEDGTTASIDQLLGAAQQAARAEKEMAMPFPTETRQGNIGEYPSKGGQYGWISKLAQNVILLALIFGVSFLTSLPIFQDLVIARIPKTLSTSGCLTYTGAFAKAAIGTALIFVLKSIFLS